MDVKTARLCMSENEIIEMLETELALYKRCCVIGGDGKPIAIGDTRFYFSRDSNFPEGRIRKVNATQFYKEGKLTCMYGHANDPPIGVYVVCSELYSSADAVPVREKG